MYKQKIVGIYKITSPTGKIYIGQSVDCKARFKLYKNGNCKGQTRLYRSFDKHGFKNHTFEIIQRCCEEWLTYFEILFIWLYDSFNTPHGLNLTDGGSNGRLSEETKKKQSESAMGKPKSEEHKQKVRLANIGKKASDETKAKMSKSHTGKIVSDHMRMMCSITKLGDRNPSYGKSPSAETRQKQRETNKKIGKRPPVMVGEFNFKSRLVLNTETGIFYSSTREAWETFGIFGNSAFRNKLNGLAKNNTSFIFV